MQEAGATALVRCNAAKGEGDTGGQRKRREEIRERVQARNGKKQAKLPMCSARSVHGGVGFQ